MGYYMTQVDSKFTLWKVNKGRAFKALKELAAAQKLEWVDYNVLSKALTLEELLDECLWELDENDHGDVTGIRFVGGKAGSERDIFKALAPFVEAGSYIEMRGEQGERWRWMFDGKTCLEKTPTVVWD